jgi:hypothetical protein
MLTRAKKMVEFDQLQTELLALPQVKGLVPVDILSLPSSMGQAIRGLVRKKTITSGELANAIGISEPEARQAAGILVDKGYLLLVEEPSSADQPSVERSDEEQQLDDKQDDAAGREENGLLRYRIHFARKQKSRIPIDL